MVILFFISICYWYCWFLLCFLLCYALGNHVACTHVCLVMVIPAFLCGTLIFLCPIGCYGWCLFVVLGVWSLLSLVVSILSFWLILDSYTHKHDYFFFSLHWLLLLGLLLPMVPLRWLCLEGVVSLFGFCYALDSPAPLSLLSLL